MAKFLRSLALQLRGWHSGLATLQPPLAYFPNECYSEGKRTPDEEVFQNLGAQFLALGPSALLQSIKSLFFLDSLGRFNKYEKYFSSYQ